MSLPPFPSPPPSFLPHPPSPSIEWIIDVTWRHVKTVLRFISINEQPFFPFYFYF